MQLPTWPADVRVRRYGLLPGPEFAPLEEIGDRFPIPDDAHANTRSYLRYRVANQPHEFHWLFGHWPTLDPKRLLYHYTPLATLGDLAGSGSLRLGPLHMMNDPRESEPWDLQVFYTPNFSMTRPVTDLTTHASSYRRHTKLICFGTDEDTEPQADTLERFLNPQRRRGYLRPRMWAQYADRGAGACVILDREALDRQLDQALNTSTIEDRFGPCHAFNGYVEYTDSADAVMEAGSLGFLMDEDYSLEKIIFDDAWTRGAFLVKDPDWASEHEYRWGLVTAVSGDDASGSLDELLVPAGDSIVGVVLGLQANDSDPAVDAFVSAFGIAANLAKVRWRENRLDVDLPVLG